MSTQQDFITFDEDVTDQELNDSLKTLTDVQSVLSGFDNRKAFCMEQYFSFYGDQFKNKEGMMQQIQKRELLEERIADNKAARDKTTNPAYRSQLDLEIAQDQTELIKVQGRLSRRDISEVMLGKTEFKTNRMYANGLDRLAERIGLWFETGAVGPGTVTYGNRTFTAE